MARPRRLLRARPNRRGGVRRRGRLYVARGEVVDVLQRCVTLLAQMLVVLLLLWGVLAVVEQIAALMA